MLEDLFLQNSVSDQSHEVGSGDPTTEPRSELELIENWWKRGGYNESDSKNVIVARQQKLLNLASVQARNLSKPVQLRRLDSVAHIGELKTDDVLQGHRKDTATRFAHDIFFEWAFLHVLVDCDTEWLEEIQGCGEPPALARPVELLAQWEFSEEENWATYLHRLENSELRSQWIRAWLVGPLQFPNFKEDERQFKEAVFADNFRLFRKTLVWFQAERTSPNASILSSDFPIEQRQQFAYLYGWRSDLPLWKVLLASFSVIYQVCHTDFILKS